MPTTDEILARAVQLHNAGRLDDAEVLYRQVLSQCPRDPNALNLLGVVLRARGNAPGAVEMIGAAIRAEPSMPGPHNNLASALMDLGRFDEAAAAAARAIALKPDMPEAHSNLGLARLNLGAVDDAIAAFQRALAVNPRHETAHSNCGDAWLRKGDREAAIRHYEAALEITPTRPANHLRLGLAHRQAGRLDVAMACYGRAIALCPDYAEAYSFLGVALVAAGRLDEAIAAYGKAIALNPGYADAHANLGNALMALGRIDEAAAAQRRAIALAPNHHEAHYNLATALLLTGELREGFREYEHRFLKKDSRTATFPQPRWDGAPLQGRTLLLHAEQGLGDTLQFCRYAAEARRLGGRVVLQVQPALVELVKTMAGADDVVASPPQDFDCHLPLMSAPLVLGTELDSIPAAIPYLAAEPDRIARWKGRLPAGGLRIGIAWQGSPHADIDIGRSIPLAAFAPLARLPGVHLVCLQKNHGLEQVPGAGFDLHHLGEDFDTGPHAFLDSAAVMMGLDLIVTSDTSIAHLAGALGRPVWVALKQIPDWRWLSTGETCPWYPSARLFRQTRAGDWTGVLERIAAQAATLTITA